MAGLSACKKFKPCPGRWSPPPRDFISRMATSIGCFIEESSHQSATPISKQEIEEDLPPQLLPAALARPTPRNVLRQTSQAALNLFFRGRAVALGEHQPSGPIKSRQIMNMGSCVVGVLDVIGKPQDRAGLATSDIVVYNPHQSRKSWPRRPSPMCRIHCLSLTSAAPSVVYLPIVTHFIL